MLGNETKPYGQMYLISPLYSNRILNSFFQLGKNNFIVIFGGEIDPSNRGHEDAGGFSNELFLINEDTLEIKIISRKDFPNMNWPITRGWSSGSSISNNQFLIFGGLTGDDKDPMRLK